MTVSGRRNVFLVGRLIKPTDFRPADNGNCSALLPGDLVRVLLRKWASSSRLDILVKGAHPNRDEVH